MSTARHQLAGPPGTGTTIDNMASRAKVWAMSSGTTGALVDSLNASSTVDVAVGQHGTNYTSPLLYVGIVISGVGQGAAFHTDVVNNAVNTHNCWKFNASNALADTTYQYIMVMGTLA